MTLGSFSDSFSRYWTMRSVSSILVPTGMESFRYSMEVSVEGMNSVPRKAAPTIESTKAAMMPHRTFLRWTSALRSQPS